MKIKYKQKYVAFLDVLGFSSMVEGGNTKTLEAYFSMVDKAFKFFKNEIKDMKMLLISDSIILSAPDTEDSLLDMIDAISDLQAALARFGIWIRGGISFGDVFYDDKKHIIVGKGYIKAYLLEKQALYPRVIIDPGILAKMKLTRKEFYELCDEHTDRDSFELKVIHDYDFYNHKRYTQDDAIFICYANTLIVNSIEDKDEQIIIDTYNHLKKGLYGDQKHYHKYLWLKKYFLECLEEFDSYLDGESTDKPKLIKYISKFKAL